MTTPSFPTLTYTFAEEMHEELNSDPTIRNEAEDGKVLTRPRFTNALRVWTYNLRMCTEPMWLALKAFERTVSYGSIPFIWTHPLTGETYSVRFGDSLQADQESNTDYYKVKLKIVEFIPNSDGATP